MSSPVPCAAACSQASTMISRLHLNLMQLQADLYSLGSLSALPDQIPLIKVFGSQRRVGRVGHACKNDV